MLGAGRLVVLFSLLGVSRAFVVQQSPFAAPASLLLPRRQDHLVARSPTTSAIFLANEDSSSRRQRRRRRRVTEDAPNQEEESTSSAETRTTPPPPRPRQDAPVSFAVTDVRNLVGGRESTTPLSASGDQTSTNSDSLSSNNRASSTDKSTSSGLPAATSSSANDSLEQLLKDAQEMQALEKGKGGTSVSSESSSNQDEPSIPKLISSVLSTIVTVDFFVVCGFLLWFLAGIFSSYVLKDDGIQIAFNSNFETLVQPALGILMIAAIASNFFKEDDEQEAA